MTAPTMPWSALRLPRRDTRTYITMDGRERYADTGRDVDEPYPTHIVIWDVYDPEAWARAVEAEGDAEAAAWRKSSRKYMAEPRRARAYQSAAQIRAEGRRRTWSVSGDYGRERAEAHAAGLRQGQPNPGVRYEAVEVTAIEHCPTCNWPRLFADGVWRHDGGRYPAECVLPEPEPDPEPERADGEFEVVTRSHMVCGFCDQTERWEAMSPVPQQLALGYLELTGVWAPGVGPEGELVVMAEATRLNGAVVWLPHLCEKIPADLYVEYADDIAASLARRAGQS